MWCRLIVPLLFIAVVSPPTVTRHSVAQESGGGSDSSVVDDARTVAPSVDPISPRQVEQQLEGPVKVEDIVAGSAWVNSTGIVDWLGPLAPLALSPFFGVTCLSGLALWGPEWATSSAVLRSTGPLQNPTLFFVFLGLTVLTSVPRLTKVSKPIAQATDRLETYAVIVILLLIKVFSSAGSSGAGAGSEVEVAMVQLGIVSFTLDTFLAIAMVINILVINSVKFFFEFMVWLTPIPFLDAVFEICNKSLCALLMAIYALSPTLATVINLVMLLAAAIVLRWISRHVRFYRTMVLDPVIASLWSGFGKPKRPELIVFPKSDFGPFQAKSRLRLRRASGDRAGWIFEEANWWMPSKTHSVSESCRPQVRRGWIMHAVEMHDDVNGPTILSFSRRYDADTLEELAQQLGMSLSAEQASEQKEKIAIEFS
jgi:hypothetical protein